MALIELTEAQEQIIRPLIVAGVTMGITLHEGEVCFKVGGFYKSGTILLIPGTGNRNEQFKAVDRYDEETWVGDTTDLCHLNHDWWERSRTRAPGCFDTPAEGWAELLVKHGILKVNEKVVREYVKA